MFGAFNAGSSAGSSDALPLMGGTVTGDIKVSEVKEKLSDYDDATLMPKKAIKSLVSEEMAYAAPVVPIQSAPLTYSGSSKSPSWMYYDSVKLTLGGVTSGTAAGTYDATFTPKAGYRWFDGTTGAKTAEWKIDKAAGSLSLNKTDMELAQGSAGTISVTRAGDGVITATSSDTSVATVSVSGTTVTVNAKSNVSGNTTITICVAEGSNYLAPSNKTCAVAVKQISTTLNINSWATIRQVSDDGKGANYWSVGDTKTIIINGKVGNTTFSSLSIDAFIIGFNHNSTKEGNNRIHFLIGKLNGKDVALCDSKDGSEILSSGYFIMNLTNTNSGGWMNSYMRKTLLGNSATPTSPLSGSLMAALPSDLRTVMKSVTKYTDNTCGGTNVASNVTATTDYLFLLAEYEVFGSRSYANSAEQNYQAQYDYFKAGNSKIAYNHSTSSSSGVRWRLRSGYYNNNNNFCVVDESGNNNNSNASYSRGVRAGFCYARSNGVTGHFAQVKDDLSKRRDTSPAGRTGRKLPFDVFARTLLAWRTIVLIRFMCRDKAA